MCGYHFDAGKQVMQNFKEKKKGLSQTDGWGDAMVGDDNNNKMPRKRRDLGSALENSSLVVSYEA